MGEVRADDLPTLRRQFPEVTDTGAYGVHDAEAGTVRVYLNLGVGKVNTEHVQVYYVKKLPPDSRCKIVTQTRATSIVLCEV